MSVTSFGAYLECPYRYYLSNVLGLEAVSDAAQEMDALVFGSLMHEVLQSFPKAIKNGRGTREAIRDCLLGSLDDELRRRFGALSPRVRLQAEVLRRRLDAFAAWQAAWSEQGYAILHTELSFRAKDKKRWIVVDGRRMYIHGRIDRIDVRDDGSEAVILDYKTSSNATTPEKSHFDGERWTDLQLPLYRHLVEGTAGLPRTRRLGYIALPSDVTQTKALIAGWTDEDLAGADEAAAGVVRNIRNRVFWPPARIPDNWTDDFADICRSTRFVARTDGQEDGDEANA
jgi:RecB family exonuclease